MLRITVELVPFGREDKSRKIAEMVIANDGNGASSNGSYEGWTSPDIWSGEDHWFGKVKNHDRSKSVWELVRKMLNNMSKKKSVPDKNKDNLSQFLKGKLS